ncbi:hypothetical protein ACFWMT_01645 [Streptomyces sp. NPDC058368]|uniref:hypothetical protein n=1 Tax=Streptomyces sp. NPDC058368 TaxID=3346461 RepID=UPI00364E8512
MIDQPAPAHAPTPYVRDMTLADCEAVATVRVRGWQSAYSTYSWNRPGRAWAGP